MLNQELEKLETLGPIGTKIKTKMEELYDKLLHKGSSPKKPDVIRMIDTSKMDYAIMIQLSQSMIATGVSEGQNLVALATAIGHKVRDYYNLPIFT